MDNNIINILKDKPIIIPRILLNNYKKLNITEEELIILIIIISLDDEIEYNPEIFVQETGMEKHQVMTIISNLISKNIISIDFIKKGKITSEYISSSLLYDKLLNIIKDVNNDDIKINNSIFTVFENELGRLLSPMEIEKIKEWITTYKNEELIIAALNEAVLNGVSNFRYIDAILNDWNKKGYRTKEDTIKDKSNYRKKKSTIEVFDTDWLNDD